MGDAELLTIAAKYLYYYENKHDLTYSLVFIY